MANARPNFNQGLRSTSYSAGVSQTNVLVICEATRRMCGRSGVSFKMLNLMIEQAQWDGNIEQQYTTPVVSSAGRSTLGIAEDAVDIEQLLNCPRTCLGQVLLRSLCNVEEMIDKPTRYQFC